MGKLITPLFKTKEMNKLVIRDEVIKKLEEGLNVGLPEVTFHCDYNVNSLYDFWFNDLVFIFGHEHVKIYNSGTIYIYEHNERVLNILKTEEIDPVILGLALLLTELKSYG